MSSVVESGWPNSLNLSLDLTLNISLNHFLHFDFSRMNLFGQFGVIKFPGKLALTACAHARLRLVGWPNALDNIRQRSTFLTLMKLHSTKQYTLDFTRQGGQTLSTFHYTWMSRFVYWKVESVWPGFNSPMEKIFQYSRVRRCIKVISLFVCLLR